MQFKTLTLATTSLVALGLAVGSASAGNEYAGKFSFSVGNAWENYGQDGGESDFDLQYPTLQGSGSVNVPYGQFVNFQFDVNGAASLDDVAGSGPWNASFFGGFSADARVYYRDPSFGALGVYFAAGRVNVGSTSSSDFAAWEFGIEGEHYCGNWTLRARAGYLDSDYHGWILQEAGRINFEALYYAGKNLRLSAGLGYADGDVRTGGNPSSFVDSTQWQWSVGLQYKFGKTIPAILEVQYLGQNVETHYSSEADMLRNALNVGLTFPFGGSNDDIKDMDREGVGYNPIEILIAPRVSF